MSKSPLKLYHLKKSVAVHGVGRAVVLGIDYIENEKTKEI